MTVAGGEARFTVTSMNVEIAGPPSSRIVLYIEEPNHSVSATALWGPDASPEMTAMVRIALATPAVVSGPENTVSIGHIEISDSLGFRVGGQAITAAEAGERIASFIVGALRAAISSPEPIAVGEVDAHCGDQAPA